MAGPCCVLCHCDVACHGVCLMIVAQVVRVMLSLLMPWLPAWRLNLPSANSAQTQAWRTCSVSRWVQRCAVEIVWRERTW